MRFATIALFIAPWFVALPAQAQQTQPAAAPTTAPAYLEQFDAGYSTLIVVPDPLPNVGRVLTHGPLQQLWNQGKLTRFIRGEQKVALPNLHAAWFMVLQNQRWVPGEIVLGMRAATMQSFGQILQLLYVSELLDAARALDAPDEAATLQQELLATLKQLKMPTLRVWVRFRDDADADAVFAMVAENGPGLLADTPLELETDERAVRVRFDLSTYLADPEARMIFLESMGWISGEDDPNRAPLGAALGNVATSVVLERAGGGLLLTIGESPAGAAPMTAQELGPLFSADDRTIAFATWDIRELVKASRDWVRLLDAWQDTPIGQTVAEADEQDFVGDLRSMARQLQQIGTVGAMRAWGGDNRIGFRAQQAGPPAALALADVPLMRFIPETVEGFGIDTVSTLSERVSGSFSEFEGRLAIREMRALNRPDRATEVKRILDAYYGPIDPLRQFVFHESQDWFRPGFGFVLGTRGTITRLELHSKNDVPFTLNNLPVPEFALLGVPTDARRDGEYFKRFYDHLVTGITNAIANDDDNGNDDDNDAPRAIEPREPTLVKEIDLGLDVPTFGFDGAWIGDLLDENFNDQVTITLDGDVRPHYFVRDGVLVFSTSPRLSKQMLAAQRVAPLKLPADDASAGALVGYGRLSGSVFQSYFDIAAKWATTFSNLPSTRPAGASTRPLPHRPRGATGPATRAFDDAGVATVLEGIGEFFGLIETMQWRSHQATDQRDMRGHIMFTE